MTPAWCPKSDQPLRVVDGEQPICPGCARHVQVIDGRIRGHKLPAVAARSAR